MHVWIRRTRPANLDALLAQLTGLPETHLCITRQPGKAFQQVQFFAEDVEELRPLRKNLGGQIRAVQEQDWLAPMQKHPPILIRDRFALVESFSGQAGARREIMIPAGLAFGTGDHPTTATCLRLLCDVAKKLPAGEWSLLDAGCGSGVLAIAGRLLGAGRVSGFDYDARAIQTARENSRANEVAGIRWERHDLLRYKSSQSYDVVAANIFSELFLAAWPELRKSLAPNGFFILSGILHFQAAECRAALVAQGLTVRQEARRGKWVTFLAQVRHLAAKLPA